MASMRVLCQIRMAAIFSLCPRVLWRVRNVYRQRDVWIRDLGCVVVAGRVATVTCVAVPKGTSGKDVKRIYLLSVPTSVTDTEGLASMPRASVNRDILAVTVVSSQIARIWASAMLAAFVVMGNVSVKTGTLALLVWKSRIVHLRAAVTAFVTPMGRKLLVTATLVSKAWIVPSCTISVRLRAAVMAFAFHLESAIVHLDLQVPAVRRRCPCVGTVADMEIACLTSRSSRGRASVPRVGRGLTARYSPSLLHPRVHTTSIAAGKASVSSTQIPTKGRRERLVVHATRGTALREIVLSWRAGYARRNVRVMAGAMTWQHGARVKLAGQALVARLPHVPPRIHRCVRRMDCVSEDPTIRISTVNVTASTMGLGVITTWFPHPLHLNPPTNVLECATDTACVTIICASALTAGRETDVRCLADRRIPKRS